MTSSDPPRDSDLGAFVVADSHDGRRLRAKLLRERLDHRNGDAPPPADVRHVIAESAELQRILENPLWRRQLLRLLARMADADSRATDVFWALDAGLDRLQGEELRHGSAPAEVAQYRRQLLSRIEWLEAALDGLLNEVERLDEATAASAIPTDAP